MATVERMERIAMNRRDLRILLAVAAHEGHEDTGEPFMGIAESLIRVVTEHRSCGACGSLVLGEAKDE